jgi:DNA-binding transcriptional LysR family regulator
MVAYVPRRLALAFQPFGLKIVDNLFATPQSEISMVWRKDYDSPALAWFRQLLTSTADELQADATP